MFILTQETLGTFIFQLSSLLSTKYFVDKCHNQYMDIWWCTNAFGQVVYLHCPTKSILTRPNIRVLIAPFIY